MKIDRLIAIAIYLLNREVVSASTLAERFEVSKRTIQRDIDALNKSGIPIVSTYGSVGGYEIMDGFKLTKQISCVDDYINIITALKGLSTAYDSVKINSTLEKVLATMQGGEQRIFIDCSVAREGTLIDERLRLIENHIYNQQLLEIYYTNADSILSQRTVEPLALSYRWYGWYLFAYCRKKQDYRLFKLQRITDCRIVDGAFSKEHSDIGALMESYYASDSRTYFNIRLLCKAQVRQQVMEYLSRNIIEEHENGNFVVEMRVPFERMWFSLLMGFGNQVQVLEPEELKVMLRKKGEELLKIYNSDI